MQRSQLFRSAALGVAGASLFFLWTVSAKRVTSFVERDTEHVVGAYHLHTEHSHDSDVKQKAYIDAARALDLDFIVVTDHNVQSASADEHLAPLVLVSAELSTPLGHVVGLGTQTVASDEARSSASVLAAIETLGGRAVVAHPSDAKRPWTGPYPARGGIEIANWSASVRRQMTRMWPTLPLVGLAWLVNSDLSLAQAYDRDDGALALWDASEHASLAGFCAIDAHGWIAPRDNLKGWHLVLDRVLRRREGAALSEAEPNLSAQRADVQAALSEGHFYCSAGLLGHAPRLVFAAMQGAQLQASHGDTVAQRDIDVLVVQVPTLIQGAARLVVLRDGHVLYDAQASRWQLRAPQPGVYRIELWAQLPQLLGAPRPVPVLYSNKLTVTP